jgi:site-specific DNA-methyltransferase (cytosine-N4-specific)
MLASRAIHVGDCRDLLRQIDDDSIHCVVTSPPYWGLRDYGVADQLGLEATPEEYVAEMVKVFRDVRRVLRPDGTLWLNLGDCYAQGGRGGVGETSTLGGSRHNQNESRKAQAARQSFRRDDAEVSATQHRQVVGLKPKDMVGIPWRVAFALQADGWYLRSDIIWSKPNPMPESVTDRPTKAHEYVFLLSKSERYFYDADAIKEPVTGAAHPRGMGVNPKAGPKDNGREDQGLRTSTRFGRGAGFRGTVGKNEQAGLAIAASTNRRRVGFNERWRVKQNASFSAAVTDLIDERNRRTVWSIGTEAFAGAHFATFPRKLVEPCVLAGCPAGGIVLDPFGGSGTVGEVAEALGRRWILLELNPEYAALARQRTAQIGLLVESATAALENA